MTNEEILLQSQRDALLREARELAENPNATKADLKLADVKIAQASGLKPLYERQLRVANAMGIPVSEITKGIVTEAQREEHQNNFNLRSYLARGREARTYSGMSVATDSNGGFFVPATFYSKVTAALKLSDGLWDDSVITMYEDLHGGALTCPVIDDTSVVAIQVSENSTSAETEIPVIDRLLLPKIPTWRSQKLSTSMELLQDAGFPLEGLIANAIAGRFQRGIGAANVTTLLSSITSGATSTTANLISYDDTVELMKSLDPAYLNQPKTFFGMNFNTLGTILKLKDSQGHPIFNLPRDANGRYLLHGVPVVILPSLPNVATGNKPVVLGDFSRLLRRTVGSSFKIQRYSQTPSLAENGLVAFEGFLRTSFGMLASASSSSPLKYLTII
jgi:HK97 family phage major capsid protein